MGWMGSTSLHVLTLSTGQLREGLAQDAQIATTP